MSDYPKKKKVTRDADINRQQVALHFIDKYGQIDGAHHKTWALDQVARILNGAEIKVYQYKLRKDPDQVAEETSE